MRSYVSSSDQMGALSSLTWTKKCTIYSPPDARESSEMMERRYMRSSAVYGKSHHVRMTTAVLGNFIKEVDAGSSARSMPASFVDKPSSRGRLPTGIARN